MFIDLHLDILKFIFSMLGFRDKWRLQQTCKYLYNNLHITHVPRKYTDTFIENHKHRFRLVEELKDQELPTILNFNYFENLKSLEIWCKDIFSVPVLPITLVELNIYNLKIRFLNITSLRNLKYVTLDGCRIKSCYLPSSVVKLRSNSIKDKNMLDLTNLQSLEVRYYNHNVHVGYLTNLTSLTLINTKSDTEFNELSKLKILKLVNFELGNLALPKNLEVLTIDNPIDRINFDIPPTICVLKLRKLSFEYIFSTRITRLSLHNINYVTQEQLDMCISLTSLCIRDTRNNIKSLNHMTQLTQLTFIPISYCFNSKSIEQCTQLKKLKLQLYRHPFGSLKNLVKLENLMIKVNARYRETICNEDICHCINLKSLVLIKCPKITNLNNFTKLETLSLIGYNGVCPSISENGLQSLTNLENLALGGNLVRHKINNLYKLKKLYLNYHNYPIKLIDIENLTNLNTIGFSTPYKCDNFFKLPNLVDVYQVNAVQRSVEIVHN